MAKSRSDVKWSGFRMTFEYRTAQPFVNLRNGSHFESSVFKTNHLKTGQFVQNGRHFGRFQMVRTKALAIARTFENRTSKWSVFKCFQYSDPSVLNFL